MWNNDLEKLSNLPSEDTEPTVVSLAGCPAQEVNILKISGENPETDNRESGPNLESRTF